MKKISIIILLLAISVNFTSAQETADDLVKEAKLVFMKNDYTKALDLYKKAVEKNEADNKLDSALYLTAAMCAQKANNQNLARKYFLKVVEIDYTDAQVFKMAADVCKDVGDNDNYVKILEKAVSKYEDEALLKKLLSYSVKAKNADKVLKYSEQGIKQFPNTADFYYYKGRGLQLQKKYEPAMSEYDKAIAKSPDYVNAHIAAGTLQYQFGKSIYESAVKRYEANKTNKEFEKYLIKRKKAKSYYRRALPYLKKANELKPNNKGVKERLDKTLEML